ncbi:MAG: hypothetical protein HZC37_27250 [Burkholderiales bacterium]|nr:hypothetical protein [Burkholderiales bacterium]
MAIPSKAKWLDETSRNLFRPRSPELKLVDEAIGQYERSPTPAAMGKIKLTFEAWKRAKGPGWHANERNRSFAMTQLEADMMLVQAVRFTPQELQALAFVAQQRKQAIRALFAGKEVVFKGPTSPRQALQSAVDEVKGKGAEAAQWMRSVGKAPPADGARIVRDKLEEMARGIFNVDTLSSLGDLSGFVLGIIAQCGVSVAPVVGHVKDGYDLIVGWGKVGLALHERHGIGRRAYAIDTGAPTAAFNALKRCLADEARMQAGEATIATTSFALKTGLVFADGGAVSGPVVGALKAVAQVSLKLYALAAEREATQRANQILRDGPLDINLFKTYPLLGCYMLTSATLSDLIPIESFGQPAWMDYVETLKKRGYDGIYESAAGLIESSPWEIRGMPKRPVKGGGIGLGGTAVPGLAGDLMGDVFKF